MGRHEETRDAVAFLRIAANPEVGGVPLGLKIGEEAHDFFNTGLSLGGSV